MSEEDEGGLFIVDENSTDPVDIALYEIVKELRKERRRWLNKK